MHSIAAGPGPLEKERLHTDFDRSLSILVRCATTTLSTTHAHATVAARCAHHRANWPRRGACRRGRW